MLSLLVSFPVLSRRRGGTDEECNSFWLKFPLMISCHASAIKQTTGKYRKKNVTSLPSDKSQQKPLCQKDTQYIKADRWWAIRLDYVMADEYREIDSTWCWNRCQQCTLPCECPFVSFSSQENKLQGCHGESLCHNPTRPPSPPPKCSLNHFSLALIKTKRKLGKTRHIMNPLKGEGMKTASSTLL